MEEGLSQQQTVFFLGAFDRPNKRWTSNKLDRSVANL